MKSKIYEVLLFLQYHFLYHEMISTILWESLIKMTTINKTAYDNMAVSSSIDDKNPGKSINIKPGLCVEIVIKKDQASGKITKGIVKDILTNSSSHPHGIKVRLTDGSVGRVQSIE